MSFTRILIALDGSPIAAHAADVGCELARALGAQVSVVSVVDTTLADAVASDVSPSLLLDEARQDARRAIDAVRSEPAPAAEFLPEGKPDEEIVKTAGAWKADLIVIGSHGRRGLERMLLGSVAEAVSRHARCPVLIVRATS